MNTLTNAKQSKMNLTALNKLEELNELELLIDDEFDCEIKKMNTPPIKTNSLFNELFEYIRNRNNYNFMFSFVILDINYMRKRNYGENGGHYGLYYGEQIPLKYTGRSYCYYYVSSNSRYINTENNKKLHKYAIDYFHPEVYNKLPELKQYLYKKIDNVDGFKDDNINNIEDILNGKTAVENTVLSKYPYKLLLDEINSILNGCSKTKTSKYYIRKRFAWTKLDYNASIIPLYSVLRLKRWSKTTKKISSKGLKSISFCWTDCEYNEKKRWEFNSQYISVEYLGVLCDKNGYEYDKKAKHKMINGKEKMVINHKKVEYGTLAEWYLKLE